MYILYIFVVYLVKILKSPYRKGLRRTKCKRSSQQMD